MLTLPRLQKFFKGVAVRFELPRNALAASILLGLALTILSVAFREASWHGERTAGGAPLPFLRPIRPFSEDQVVWGNLFLSLGMNCLAVFLTLALNARWHIRAVFWAAYGAAIYVSHCALHYALERGYVVKLATAMFSPQAMWDVLRRFGTYVHIMDVIYFLSICLSSVGLVTSLDSYLSVKTKK